SIIHTLVPEQFQKKKQTILFFLITSVIATGVILLNFIELSFSLITIIYFWFALSFGACILFQGDFVSFLFVAVVYMTGLNFVEGSVLNIIGKLFSHDLVEQFQAGFSTLRIYIIIVLKLVEGLVMLLVLFILKRASLTLKKTRMTLVCAVLGFLCSTYWLSATRVVMRLKLDMIQSLLAIALVFIICAAYFYFRMIQIRREQEYTILQNKLLEKNYQMAKESYESNARLYHDMNNHFRMIQNYLSDGKASEAQAYLETINGNMALYAVKHWTGVEAVDYILSQKMELAKQYGIETDIHAEYPRDCKISPVDLCTILTNLLDNAIEASKKQPKDQKKRLAVTIRRIHQFILIRVVNSTAEAPVIKNGSLITSKKDRRYHGLGMKNVKAAVENYHGTIEFHYSDDLFTVNIILFYQ
ncbi:MAG: GHKL domain-containing protein, partial [Lachnospiraceae bacterium]|nr:GHKL domain-containing protein [Lachnospiraceae bacterium]